jgi:hypothetical protein
MPDPILATVLAKAVGEGGEASEKTALSLFARVLGPSADEIGEALRRYTAYRLRNVGRIVETADAKAAHVDDDAIVNPRVARVLLEEGSYCDDNLMTNYLGGVLAGSRTSDGRDDRAVTWSRLLTGLSALQTRSHYLLYREWAARLHEIPGLSLSTASDRDKASMHLDLIEFETVLSAGSSVHASVAVPHAIYGLIGAGLLSQDYAYGSGRKRFSVAAKTGVVARSRFERVLIVSPSPSGMELYGWAQGLPGLLPFQFTSKALPFELADPIPRLMRVDFPTLDRKLKRKLK